MKKIFFIILMASLSFMAFPKTKINLTVGQNTMAATLADNDATRELAALLEKGPITIQMSDYGGFEKVGALPQYLSTSNTQITTEPGDIMLYQGNNMVIFYGSNSWSYTRLGRIDGATAGSMRQFLGSGNISLTISLDSSSGINSVLANADEKEIVCDLSGRLISHRPLKPGIYIINGMKKQIQY